MAYDPVSGMITSIQDSFGRLTTISVNGSGDLSQIMTPDLCISSLVYDGSHQMIGLINPLGDRTTYSYLTGAVVRTQSPMGYVGSVIYHNRTPPPPFFAAPGAPRGAGPSGPSPAHRVPYHRACKSPELYDHPGLQSNRRQDLGDRRRNRVAGWTRSTCSTRWGRRGNWQTALRL